MESLNHNTYVSQSLFVREGFAVDRLLPSECPPYWPLLHEFLALTPEMWETGQTPEYIQAAVTSGMMQLWIGVEGTKIVTMALTELRGLGVAREVTVIWGAGPGAMSLERMKLFLEVLQDFCRGTGSSYVSMLGRRGWERYLSALGFKFAYSVSRMPIAKERMN